MLIEMRHPDSRSFAAGGVGIVLTALLTLPSIFGLTCHLQTVKRKEKSYQDQDGVATDESVAKYTATIPKIAIAILTLLGFLISISLAILGTLDPHKVMFLENWLNVAQWVRTYIGIFSTNRH